MKPSFTSREQVCSHEEWRLVRKARTTVEALDLAAFRLRRDHRFTPLLG